MKTNEAEIFLNERGVRPTANRILVVRELMTATHPVSLADLVLSLQTMDKASIFRVLELFAEKEIVHVIEDGSRSLKYEMCHNNDHHDINDQHAHFYCERCKETFCLEEIKVPVITTPEGFHVRTINFVLKGLCPKCSEKL
ncbi:MAG: transcriptional repressor [Muribaculaceae bacterium]|nr:transcriptional repressor [Muribaculaceae bacterium]